MNELKELPFWSVLSEAEKFRFEDNVRIITTTKRQTIYAANDGMHMMHFVLSGRVKVCRYFGDMREIILDIIPHGEFVSFQPIIEMPDEIEYAETVQISTIVQINSVFIRDLMAKNASFSAVMFQQLANRFNKMSVRLALVHPTILIREQVAKLLIELAESFGRKVGDEIIVEHGLSQHELAAMINRTRQSITGVLRQMKKADLINYTRTSILIRDVERLKQWGKAAGESK